MQSVTDEDFKQGTAKDCVAICKQKDFAYAAIEDGTKCVCGNEYNTQGEVDRQECSQSSAASRNNIEGLTSQNSEQWCEQRMKRRMAVYSVNAVFSDLQNPAYHPYE